jgi:hypothetical protein
LQDSLGEVNDAVASGELLREALKRKPKVRKFLDDRAAAATVEFSRYWNATFDAPGREAWWTDFLARPVSQAATRRKPKQPKNGNRGRSGIPDRKSKAGEISSALHQKKDRLRR